VKGGVLRCLKSSQRKRPSTGVPLVARLQSQNAVCSKGTLIEDMMDQVLSTNRKAYLSRHVEWHVAYCTKNCFPGCVS